MIKECPKCKNLFYLKQEYHNNMSFEPIENKGDGYFIGGFSGGVDLYYRCPKCHTLFDKDLNGVE